VERKKGGHPLRGTVVEEGGRVSCDNTSQPERNGRRDSVPLTLAESFKKGERRKRHRPTNIVAIK